MFSRAVPLILLIIWLLPSSAAGAGKDKRNELPRFLNVDVDSLVRHICTDSGTDEIGGIWQSTIDGSTVGIVPAYAWAHATGAPLPERERTNSAEWLLIFIDTPMPRVQPGTIAGWFTLTAQPRTYDARLFTKRSKNEFKRPKQFILTLHDETHLSLRKIHKGVKVNPWRFLPYFIRGSFSSQDDTPKNLDGFLKVWPEPAHPISPRYL